MALDGQFDDLDACLHWHPGGRRTASEYGSSKAVISAKFTFTGLAAHASGSPDKGRSALDGVELMNVGANYMREHVKETSRIHYVITNGGGQPNVVPATAQVWYYVRANTHEDAGAAVRLAPRHRRRGGQDEPDQGDGRRSTPTATRSSRTCRCRR